MKKQELAWEQVAASASGAALDVLTQLGLAERADWNGNADAEMAVALTGSADALRQTEAEWLRATVAVATVQLRGWTRLARCVGNRARREAGAAGVGQALAQAERDASAWLRRAPNPQRAAQWLAEGGRGDSRLLACTTGLVRALKSLQAFGASVTPRMVRPAVRDGQSAVLAAAHAADAVLRGKAPPLDAAIADAVREAMQNGTPLPEGLHFRRLSLAPEPQPNGHDAASDAAQAEHDSNAHGAGVPLQDGQALPRLVLAPQAEG